jgi:hypothetical protein
MVGVVDTDDQQKKHLAILSDIDTLVFTARQEAIEEVIGIVKERRKPIINVMLDPTEIVESVSYEGIDIKELAAVNEELQHLLTALRGLSGKKE